MSLIAQSGFFFEHEPSVAVPSDCYRRRRQRRQFQFDPNEEPSFDKIIDHEHLISVFNDLKVSGGQAPGPDGIWYCDLSRREVGATMRALSSILRDGDYHPGQCRVIPIPKVTGGTRELRIRSIFARVVSKAVNDALIGFWDRHFLPCAMGFRPGRGTWLMLAEILWRVAESGCWVVAIDDIRHAFDNVDIEDVLCDHRRYLNSEQLLDLVEKILRGNEGTKRTVGIDQGDPYSPTCLNIRLHHGLDLRLASKPTNPAMFRYADNLIFLCKTVSEGKWILDRARSYLRIAGLELKGTDGPPIDLKSRRSAPILGFSLYREKNQVRVRLGKDAWSKLRQALEEAHDKPDPPRVASQTVRGWINAFAPALESFQDEDLDRVLQLTANYGFREIFSRISLRLEGGKALKRWKRFRSKSQGTFKERPCD